MSKLLSAAGPDSLPPTSTIAMLLLQPMNFQADQVSEEEDIGLAHSVSECYIGVAENGRLPHYSPKCV